MAERQSHVQPRKRRACQIPEICALPSASIGMCLILCYYADLIKCILFDSSKVVSNLFPATASRKAIDDSMVINWSEASTSSVMDFHGSNSPMKLTAAQQLAEPSDERNLERFIEEKLESLLKETKQWMKNKHDNGINSNSMP